MLKIDFYGDLKNIFYLFLIIKKFFLEKFIILSAFSNLGK